MFNKFDAAYQQAVSAYTNAANMPVTLSSSDSDNSDSAFAGIVKGVLQDTAQTINRAENTSSKALVKEADISDVVTSVGEAEMALQTVVAIRDRMISAYQDIIKMPI